MTATDYSDQFRKMGMKELLQWTAGWKPGCYERLAGEQEIHDRRTKGASLRGWIAIILSVISLIVSVCVALFKT